MQAIKSNKTLCQDEDDDTGHLKHKQRKVLCKKLTRTEMKIETMIVDEDT